MIDTNIVMSVDCLNCNEKIPFNLSRLKNNQNLVCNKCGQTNFVDYNSIIEGFQALEDSIPQILKSAKEKGKL